MNNTLMFGGSIAMPSIFAGHTHQWNTTPTSDDEARINFVKGSNDKLYMTQSPSTHLMALLGAYDYDGVKLIEGEALELYKILYE